jgi:hypothetical protein
MPVMRKVGSEQKEAETAFSSVTNRKIGGAHRTALVTLTQQFF